MRQPCMKNKYRWTHEYDENAEDLQHKPTVAGDAGVIFQQLPLCARYIRRNVLCVCVDALDRLPLLGYHLRKLCEDLTQFGDSRLDRLDSGRTRLNVSFLSRQGIG